MRARTRRFATCALQLSETTVDVGRRCATCTHALTQRGREGGRGGEGEGGREGGRESGTERESDRETERQGDRETGRQGDRETGTEMGGGGRARARAGESASKRDRDRVRGERAGRREARREVERERERERERRAGGREDPAQTSRRPISPIPAASSRSDSVIRVESRPSESRLSVRVTFRAACPRQVAE